MVWIGAQLFEDGVCSILLKDSAYPLSREFPFVGFSIFLEGTQVDEILQEFKAIVKGGTGEI